MANPLEHTLDKTGRLDDETIRVVESVLCDTHPPINPAVLLLAMRNWYLVHGSGPVLRAFLDWLSQIMNFDRAGDYTPCLAEGRGVHLIDLEVSILQAGVTGFPELAVGTVDRHGHNPGQGGLAAARNPDKLQGSGNPAGGELVLELFDGVGVTDHLAETSRPQ
jgi:hypothetical protein